MKPAEILKRESAKALREALEEALALHLRAAGIPSVRQYRFNETRRWKFDFAFLPQALAVEVQGGIWSSGRHSRGQGITDEAEKFAHAVIAGWRVMPVTGDQIKSGQALLWIKAALGVL